VEPAHIRLAKAGAALLHEPQIMFGQAANHVIRIEPWMIGASPGEEHGIG
jgi:hypothetical protein